MQHLLSSSLYAAVDLLNQTALQEFDALLTQCGVDQPLHRLTEWWWWFLNKILKRFFFFFKKKEKVYFLICTKWERTTPPLRSSDHSLGGGCRSPADSGDASTVSAFAPCPGRAVWWRATYAHTKPHAVLKANDKQTKCLTLSWGGSHWGSPCQTKLQSSYSSRRFSSLDPPPFPRRLHSQQCTGTHQTVDTKYPNKCGFAPSEWMSWKIKWRRLSSALWFL